MAVERQDLCIKACEGIPNSYLERGYTGLKAWFANRGIDHDTLVSLADLGRHLPLRRGKSYVYKLASAGLQRRDGLNIKLETVEFNGYLASSVENYFRMMLRLDGSQIVCIEKRPDDTRLCMAMCSICESWLKFPVSDNDVREAICRERFQWRKMNDDSWACNICAERLCQNQAT